MGNKLKTLSYFMVHGKSGEVFYSDKRDKDITALAVYSKAKVRTKIVLLIEDMTVRKVTKITKE